ncbi:MAG: restriction endonuclease subunit S, partial [Polaromonas sp.]
MKAGWRLVPLGDVCQVIGGGTPPKNIAKYYEGKIPWATVRDMRSETITETECNITTEAVKDSATNIIPAGNVVIATRVGLGKVCLLAQDTAINQDLRGIVPIDLKTISVRFLFYWLKSVSQLIVAEGTGATVQGVKLPFVKSLQMPIASLAEQQHIVAILDEAFDGIATAKANTEKNLQNAHALFKNHLQSLFNQRREGWVATTIGEQFILQRGFDITKEQQRTGAVPVVSSGGIKSFHDTSKVDGPGVVIGRKGTLGKVFYLAGGFWPHDTTLWVKEFNANNPRFVYYFLRNLDVAHLDTGTANPALNRNLLHPIPITWPPREKQLALTETFDEIEAETQRLESIYQQKLVALDELKKSLLHQAFTGQLTARKPSLAASRRDLQTATPQFAANIISLAYAKHAKKQRERTFGRVKEQKVLHLVETIAKIDLGRRPMKDAAGPNDFQHMLKAEDWARTQDFFEMIDRGNGYDFKKLKDFDKHLSKAKQELAPCL